MRKERAMLRRLREAWRRATVEKWSEPALTEGALSAASAADSPAVFAFREEVLTRFPYTDEARHWLSTAIAFEVQLRAQPPTASMLNVAASTLAGRS
jgi:hypothetical protein